jgi:hypothetical protein
MNTDAKGQETPGLVKITQNSAADFRQLAPYAAVMGIIFAAGAYRNAAGIAYAFVIAAALVIHRIVLRRQGVETTKNRGMRRFYECMLLLLGISFCTTDSEQIHMLDFLAFLILGILYLQLCYDGRALHILSCAGALFRILFLPLTHIFTPFKDLAEAVHEWKQRRRTAKGVNEQPDPEEAAVRHSWKMQILAGVLIAIPLMIVILMLLASADAVFRDLMESIFTFEWPRLNLDFSSLAEILFLFCLCYWCAYLAWKMLNRERNERTVQGADGTREAWQIPTATAATILLPATAVYLLFSVVQLFFVFGRSSLPEGVTYADYVHEGFYQLCAVAVINLILYGLFKNRASQSSGIGSRLLKSLLTLLCACTYIILISAAYRMILYIRAYQLTFLRLFVLWFMLVLTVWMTVLIAGNYLRGFNTLTALIVSTSILYLAFALPHPDYWIARFNMSSPKTDAVYQEWEAPIYYAEKKYQDPWYLIHLSDDAVPAFAEDPGMLEYYRLYCYCEEDENSGYSQNGLNAVRCWNLSNWIAELYSH